MTLLAGAISGFTDRRVLRLYTYLHISVTTLYVPMFVFLSEAGYVCI